MWGVKQGRFVILRLPLFYGGKSQDWRALSPNASRQSTGKSGGVHRGALGAERGIVKRLCLSWERYDNNILNVQFLLSEMLLSLRRLPLRGGEWVRENGTICPLTVLSPIL